MTTCSQQVKMSYIRHIFKLEISFTLCTFFFVQGMQMRYQHACRVFNSAVDPIITSITCLIIYISFNYNSLHCPWGIYLNLSCNVGVQMCDMGLPLGRAWGFVSALRSASAIIAVTFCICLLSLLQSLCYCCCYYLFAALLAQLIGKLLQFQLNWNGNNFDDNCKRFLNGIRWDTM